MAFDLLFLPLKKGGRGGERSRLQAKGLRLRERPRASEGRESRSDLLLRTDRSIKSKSPSVPLFQRGKKSR
jgi:hypothetical protein